MHKFNTDLDLWVKEISQLTCAAKTHWCTGTQEEYQSLTQYMVENKQLKKLNATTHPNCFLHLSNPNDVARTEHLTFVCKGAFNISLSSIAMILNVKHLR